MSDQAIERLWDLVDQDKKTLQDATKSLEAITIRFEKESNMLKDRIEATKKSIDTWQKMIGVLKDASS